MSSLICTALKLFASLGGKDDHLYFESIRRVDDGIVLFDLCGRFLLICHIPTVLAIALFDASKLIRISLNRPCLSSPPLPIA